MLNVRIEVDTKGFEEAFRKYMEVTDRSLTDAVNTHAYFIARDAVNTTRAAEKDIISNDLRKTSRLSPTAPIAAILVNKQRKAAGKKGLYGEKMSSAVEKFIRKRQSFRNFLRAGWLPAIKALAPSVKKKSGAKKLPAGVKVKGKPKGGGRSAQESGKWNPVATIWNAVHGSKGGSPEVTELISRGLQEAVNQETQSMLDYIKRKLSESAKFFN